MSKVSHLYFQKLLKFIEDNPQSATLDSKSLLRKLKGKQLVIYFYPRDNTPVCTREGREFASLYQTFQKYNTEIIGVSRNNVASHERFKSQQGFPFELISDFQSNLCKMFKVDKKIKLLGTSRMIISRTTFLFNREGALLHEWRNVKVKGHVNEVLTMVEGMND